jgi:energy-coupling factor transporter ATP-binding protein EcfA2
MNSGGPDVLSLPGNPFSTRFICPDANSYLFPENADAMRLVATLRESGWWGQIVGPHGSGKTTLLHTLVPRIEEAGRRVELHVLHQSDRRLAAARRTRRGWNSQTQVVIDGYEQLDWLSRTRLKRNCRSRGAGLLVTAHVPTGLPHLWRTEPSLELAQTLVTRLLPAEYTSWITTEDVSRAFSAHRGNLREMLLSLYDVFEDRSKEAGAQH